MVDLSAGCSNGKAAIRQYTEALDISSFHDTFDCSKQLLGVTVPDLDHSSATSCKDVVLCHFEGKHNTDIEVELTQLDTGGIVPYLNLAVVASRVENSVRLNWVELTHHHRASSSRLESCEGSAKFGETFATVFPASDGNSPVVVTRRHRLSIGADVDRPRANALMVVECSDETH